jgi:hypothetical protein
MNDLLQLLRKLLLIANGLVFLGFAISTTLNIDFTADFYAFTLNGIGGHNEFRAVFMGFWLGLTVIFLQSVRHYRVAVLGDMAFTLVLLQSLGRLYSFAADGIPPARFVAFFVLEFSSALVGLLIRPAAPRPDS